MKVKPWQMIVIVLGLLVGAGSLAYSFVTTEAVPINYIAHYIDVETGDIYRVDTSKRAVGAPARHPSNGRMCLVRLSREKNEKKKKDVWFVNPRDRSTIDMLDKDVKNIAVNRDTGELLVPWKSPIDYK